LLEKLNRKVNFGLVIGKSLSGKTSIAKIMAEKLDYSIIDMKSI
jgi:shikimate kinase